MKKLMPMALLALFTVNSYAVDITSARVNDDETGIIATITNYNSKNSADYHFRIGACSDNIPQSCEAKIVENDFNESGHNRDELEIEVLFGEEEDVNLPKENTFLQFNKRTRDNSINQVTVEYRMTLPTSFDWQ